MAEERAAKAKMAPTASAAVMEVGEMSDRDILMAHFGGIPDQKPGFKTIPMESTGDASLDRMNLRHKKQLGYEIGEDIDGMRLVTISDDRRAMIQGAYAREHLRKLAGMARTDGEDQSLTDAKDFDRNAQFAALGYEPEKYSAANFMDIANRLPSEGDETPPDPGLDF